MPSLGRDASTLGADAIYGRDRDFAKTPVSRAVAEFCKMFQAPKLLTASVLKLASMFGTILAIPVAERPPLDTIIVPIV